MAKWLKDHPEPVHVRSAAELLASLAEAMQYTHSRGVVHRDLKPSNILLPAVAADADDRCTSGFGQPKITDFGLAKLLEHQGEETRSGLLLGTPAYMAPEQAEGRLREVGPATDVYSLGVILYELLTGRAPFGGPSDLDTLRQIGQGEPVAPGRLRPGLPRDLEAICLKCLEKSPQHRYPLAGELAQDLRRFLAGQPTHARPLSSWQRALKWSRRRPALATLVGVIVLAVLSISSLVAWHVTQVHAKNLELQAAVEEAREQRGLAIERELQTRQEAYGALMGRAGELLNRGHTGFLAELLTKLRPDPGAEDLRGFAWHYLWRLAHKERFLRGHNYFVQTVAFSPDGKLCASGSDDQTVKLWNAATGNLHANLEGHTAPVVSVAFSPDGKQLASAGWQPGEVKLWEVATGRPLADLTGPMMVVQTVAFAPDGPRDVRTWRSLPMEGTWLRVAVG